MIKVWKFYDLNLKWLKTMLSTKLIFDQIHRVQERDHNKVQDLELEQQGVKIKGVKCFSINSVKINLSIRLLIQHLKKNWMLIKCFRLLWKRKDVKLKEARELQRLWYEHILSRINCLLKLEKWSLVLVFEKTKLTKMTTWSLH